MKNKEVLKPLVLRDQQVLAKDVEQQIALPEKTPKENIVADVENQSALGIDTCVKDLGNTVCQVEHLGSVEVIESDEVYDEEIEINDQFSDALLVQETPLELNSKLDVDKENDSSVP